MVSNDWENDTAVIAEGAEVELVEDFCYLGKLGRPRKNWMDIVRRDLKDMGMKPRNWRQTEQNGVSVWPNAFIWMRDELRSKVR